MPRHKQTGQMSKMPFEGRTLGRYRVLEPLGRGGMAWVYRAYHAQLDRYVAVKILRSELVDDAEFRERFQREARAVASLRHPHIIQVFDFDVEDDVYYMVMEYLEGDTLKARLNDYRVRGERMPLGEALRIMIDTLDGLAYAHSEGMIHRDIKPSNILLTKRGQAVIGDFGIAHMIGGTHYTATGALMGTPEYMAPEYGLHGEANTSSDVYALGIILFEMLTQRIPFEAETPLATLMKHVHDPLPLPRELNPGIPEAIERIVLKALSKSPEDRYPGATAMAEALGRAIAEAEIEVPERISLPLSFATCEAPSESVVVASRPADRAHVDTEVAEAITNVTLRTRHRKGRSKPHKSGDGQADRDTGGPSRDPAPAARGLRNATHSRLAMGLLLVIGIVSLGNLFGVTLSSLLDNWAAFERGWPMEFLLVGAGLFMLMAVTQVIWLSIPAAIVTANGILFAYSTFTQNWHHWAFLWFVEIWVAALAVAVSIALAQQPPNARKISRLIGWAAGAVALLGAFSVQGGALASDLAASLLDKLH